MFKFVDKAITYAKICSTSLSFHSLLSLVQCVGSRDSRLHESLKKMASDLNESAPIMLDAYTRFDEAIVTDENHFRYQYTVLNTDNPDSLLTERLQDLTENIRSMFSTSADLAIFRKNNVVLEYIYRDHEQRELRSITIGPEDYQ